MANRVASNPIVLDTFTSDVVISTGRVKVSKITIASATAGDIVEFIDKAGNPVFRLVQSYGTPGSSTEDFDQFVFENGLTFDTSASTGLGSGDLVFIYLA